jgi:hypothetical protein
MNLSVSKNKRSSFVRFAVTIIAIPAWLQLPTNPTMALDVTNCEQRPGRPQATPAETQAVQKLIPLRQCKAPIDDRTACNVFLGRALEILYGNKDFKVGPGYMLANDIVNGLETPGNAGWSKIGMASDQPALDKAQEFANHSRPVVAARSGQRKPDGTVGPGHVALILPGTSEMYNFDGFDWGNLKVPNSASFFLDRPDRFFAGCPISAVWKKPEGVALYYKP